MAVGQAVNKALIDSFIQGQAGWLLGIWQSAQKFHQEALQISIDEPTLKALGYTSADVNSITAIIYQLDRLQTLLGGTIPGSASAILADAAAVLQPGT